MRSVFTNSTGIFAVSSSGPLGPAFCRLGLCEGLATASICLTSSGGVSADADAISASLAAATVVSDHASVNFTSSLRPASKGVCLATNSALKASASTSSLSCPHAPTARKRFAAAAGAACKAKSYCIFVSAFVSATSFIRLVAVTSD